MLENLTHIITLHLIYNIIMLYCLLQNYCTDYYKP